MRHRKFLLAVATGFGLYALASSVLTAQQAWGAEQSWKFEDVPAGTLPAGWRIAATNSGSQLAAWRVVAGRGAKSGDRVLALTGAPDGGLLSRIVGSNTFNLCWTDAVKFQDGEIEMSLRADSGRSDQGGGPIWRVKDAGNYYIARYNPLEHNFRLYFVRDGSRVQLADASDLAPKTGEWFTIKIVQRGSHIEGWLDGKKLLEAEDRTFSGPGGIGLWTKSDAATSFDDITVRTTP
ncbi:MAG: DUF1080 domain-containing protein [Alphaproteobacteria bacterium]|nr:DUF1080 domain-containing protein [Alphaproteobacteria bacterium]